MPEYVVSLRGFSLAEQVLALGLLGLILLAVAAMSVQARRGGIAHRHLLEASSLAHDLLELQMARSVYDMPLGTIDQFSGYFQDDTPYQADVQSSTLVGSAPAYAGLTDKEVKKLTVEVRWRDVTGNRLTRAQSVLARLPK
ncbi:MAG: hypothetical protein U0931_24015 [Vulcanimicrobiota bacterium]